MKKHNRLDLAMNQFETAVALFLAKKDYFSVITLAGAADVVFCQMITRNGESNLTDILVDHDEKERSREEVGREVNDLLFINDLKHLDPGKDEYISLNAYECAYTTILKGLANYNAFDSKNSKVVSDFLEWGQKNLDPDKYNIYCDPNWKPKA